MKLIPHSLSPVVKVNGIRSLIGFGSLVGPLVHSVLYLRYLNLQGHTSICFEENQLSRNLIGLSPLSTVHPKSFQRSPVRASTGCYTCFTLTMDRSSRFGSIPNYLRPFKTRFRYGYTLFGLTLQLRITH